MKNFLEGFFEKGKNLSPDEQQRANELRDWIKKYKTEIRDLEHQQIESKWKKESWAAERADSRELSLRVARQQLSEKEKEFAELMKK